MTITLDRTSAPDTAETGTRLRMPQAEDGLRIFELVEKTANLDDNSMYCNLLQASHFAGTSIVAEDKDGLLGFVTGYRPPEDPDTLFVWQVCVDPRGRGKGLGRKMISALIERDTNRDVKKLQSTITADNDASWALFKSIAKQFGARLTDTPHFEKGSHFGGRHDTEFLVTIGPLRAH